MNATADSLKDTTPVVTWTWQNGRGGMLSTQIFAGGQILQLRQHDVDDEVTPQELGVIPASQAAALATRCREALRTGASAMATGSQAGADDETYQLVLADDAQQETSRQISRRSLASDRAMETVRREVLAARKQVWRRWNIWTSAGARWFFLTAAVTMALGIYIVYDIKHDGQLQARSQTVTATVVERNGVPYKSESLTVKVNTDKHVPDVHIYKYLSHANWESAQVGSSVDLVYDAQSGQGWLAADLMRWQHDKNTIWVIPAFLLAMAFVGLAWLRRYQIGVYGNGEEYMILEDRVVTDDRNFMTSRRSNLLWFKMFI